MPSLLRNQARPKTIPIHDYPRYGDSIFVRYCTQGDIMTPQELKTKIEQSEMPSSVSASYVDELTTCPHFCEGKCDIEICENEPVLDYDAEQF